MAARVAVEKNEPVQPIARHPQAPQDAWLARHPRWVFHFTPTSESWRNAVESFFSKTTRQRIRRGVFRSIANLETAIIRYLKEHNDDPKPFVWTKPADVILAKARPSSCNFRLSQCTSEVSHMDYAGQTRRNSPPAPEQVGAGTYPSPLPLP